MIKNDDAIANRIDEYAREFAFDIAHIIDRDDDSNEILFEYEYIAIDDAYDRDEIAFIIAHRDEIKSRTMQFIDDES